MSHTPKHVRRPSPLYALLAALLTASPLAGMSVLPTAGVASAVPPRCEADGDGYPKPAGNAAAPTATTTTQP
jgi:hypothetical protein